LDAWADQGENPVRGCLHLYQLECHMKTTMKSLFAGSYAIAAAALLGFWFTFGAAQMARAEDAETLSPPGQDMVLVPVKTVSALEQRVIYLEETVAALTESWQHINTHRLCVSDDSGAETCVTKAQLDVLLTQSPRAEISQAAVSQEAKAAAPAESAEVAVTTETSPPSEPTAVAGEQAAVSQEAKVAAAAESVEVAVTTETSPPSEPTAVVGEDVLPAPTTVVGENVLPNQDPESTGSVKSASDGSSTGAAVVSYPKVEIYEEPVARSED
jgi:hypothetical protein